MQAVNPLLEPYALIATACALTLTLLWGHVESMRQRVPRHVRVRRTRGVRELLAGATILWLGLAVAIGLPPTVGYSAVGIGAAVGIGLVSCGFALFHFGRALNLLRSGNSPEHRA